MSNKTQLPDELQKKLTDEANAYANGKVGDIQTIPANKINEWEKAADGWEAGATAYAIKLQEAQQEKAKAVDFLRRLRSITTWLDMPSTSGELLNEIDNYLK